MDLSKKNTHKCFIFLIIILLFENKWKYVQKASKNENLAIKMIIFGAISAF